MVFFEATTLLLAATLSFFTIYLKIPATTKEQMIAILLLISLVLITRVIFTNSRIAKSSWFKLLTLFLSSALVQMLVVASGGLYSPFLILIHLVTIGLSFILSIASSLFFLLFSIVLLILDIRFDSAVENIFSQDQFSALLYVISFAIIVPVSFLVAKLYHLKDSVSKILTEYVQMGRIREESILSGLNELVFITDTDLSVLYINSQAEKELGTSTPAALRQHLLNILPLKDGNGGKINGKSLSVDQALIDKATRVVSNLYLYGRRKIKVSVLVRPIIDLAGKVTQIVFVVTDAKIGNGVGYGNHSNLEGAREKYNAMFEDIRKTLLLNQSQEMVAKIELMHKIEEDLLIATEIEDHSLKENVRFQDVAVLCKQVAVTKRSFARGLKIPINFSLPESEVNELSLLSLVESNASESVIPISDFMVPADFKWLKIMVEKIVDILLLLSVGETDSRVYITAGRDNTNAFIELTARCSVITAENRNELFLEHFGSLGESTNLRFGSGIEGYIINMIREQLEIPLAVNLRPSPPTLSFVITLSKKAR